MLRSFRSPGAAPLGHVARRRTARARRSPASRGSCASRSAKIATCASSLVARGAVRAVQHQRRQEAHAGQRRGLLVGRQEGVEEVAVVAVGPVRRLRRRRSRPPATGPCRAAGRRPARRPSRRRTPRRATASSAAACRTSGSGAATPPAAPAPARPARRRRRSGSRGTARRGRAPRRAPVRRLAAARAHQRAVDARVFQLRVGDEDDDVGHRAVRVAVAAGARVVCPVQARGRPLP